MRKEDLFSEKPAPFLPTIKGIPLPEDEGGFFEEQDANDDPLEIPENSKLSPKDFINRPEDQAPLRAIDTDNSNDEYDGGNLNRVQN
jgi:hypothetical protein